MAVRVRRRELGRPRTRLARVLAEKAFSSQARPVLPAAAGYPARHPRQGRPESPPPQARLDRRPPPDFDAQAYKQRNTVERCFNKLKSFRAVATRYDKRECIYQGTIDVASIRIWLRDPVT